MKLNYDFPWYIQNSPAFMTLYTGFYDIAKNISPLPFLDMLDMDNITTYYELMVAANFYGLSTKWYATQGALIYNRREWGPRPEGLVEYYWNGRASVDTIKIMANYIRAKTQIRGQPLTLVNLKKFYETALDGYDYSVENNIEVIESLQHFEIVVTAPENIINGIIEMSFTDRWPFGKPVGISYNITYIQA